MMANQVPQNEQGELQGINASVGSIGAIFGPLIMTQSFSYFTGPETPLYHPDIAFLIAGALAIIAVALFALNLRVIKATCLSQRMNDVAGDLGLVVAFKGATNVAVFTIGEKQ
ncbi:MAG: hypothetical protein AAF525_11340 [Pseudomonadota bacterium]